MCQIAHTDCRGIGRRGRGSPDLGRSLHSLFGYRAPVPCPGPTEENRPVDQSPIECRILLPGPREAVTVFLDVEVASATEVWLRVEAGRSPLDRTRCSAVWRLGQWRSMASLPGFVPGIVLRDALSRGSWMKGPPPQHAESVLAVLNAAAGLSPARVWRPPARRANVQGRGGKSAHVGSGWGRAKPLHSVARPQPDPPPSRR